MCTPSGEGGYSSSISDEHLFSVFLTLAVGVGVYSTNLVLICIVLMVNEVKIFIPCLISLIHTRLFRFLGVFPSVVLSYVFIVICL